MAKVIKLRSPGPDDPDFPGRTFVSAPITRPPGPAGLPPDVRVRFSAQIWKEALEQWEKRPRPILRLVNPAGVDRTLRPPEISE